MKKKINEWSKRALVHTVHGTVLGVLHLWLVQSMVNSKSTNAMFGLENLRLFDMQRFLIQFVFFKRLKKRNWLFGEEEALFAVLEMN